MRDYFLMEKTVRKQWLMCFMTCIIFVFLTSAALAKTSITHIHYANHGADWYEWLQERAIAFENLHPDIEIDILISGDGTGVDQLRAMAAGNTLPDVTELALTYGGAFADDGFFLDLRPFVERDPEVTLDLFAPITVDALKRPNGELWGIPADIYSVPTYYNKDIFAEGGLANPGELGDEWDWDAVVDVGRKLSRDTNNDGVFEQRAITGLAGMWSHMAVVRQAGGMLFDNYKDPQQSLLNTPEVERAIQWLVELYRDYGVLESGWHEILYGRSAVTLTVGPSWINSLNNAGINFDVALQPKGPASRAAYTAVNGFQIIKTSPHAAEAWEWIKFLTTDEESVMNFIMATGRLPALLSVARMYGNFIYNPPDRIHVLLDNVLDPASFHPPIGTKSQEAMRIFNSLRVPLSEGALDVRSALEDAHRRISAVLNEN